VFEPAPPPDAAALSTLDDIPRPFVIAPAPAAGRAYRAGDEVAFDLNLIGRAREFFPHFVVTLRELRALGRGRHPVALRRIEAVDSFGGRPTPVYRDAEIRPLVERARRSVGPVGCGRRRPRHRARPLPPSCSTP